MNSKTAAGIEFDKGFYSDTIKVIAGADEVGRGPLAGPVVAACVIMGSSEIIDGVRDSKLICESKREKLFEQIKQNAAFIGIGSAEPKEIDEINILNATRNAFKKALIGLTPKPDLVLMDYITGVETDLNCKAFKHGDGLSYAIACASIVAKVTRDRFMIDMDRVYPEYGFARNKGYGTKEHIEALKKFGPCPLHRRSFIGKFVGNDL